MAIVTPAAGLMMLGLDHLAVLVAGAAKLGCFGNVETGARGMDAANHAWCGWGYIAGSRNWWISARSRLCGAYSKILIVQK